MAVDLKAIDRKIKKLQRFKEFALEFDNDPEFRELIAEFSAKNGNGLKAATGEESHATNGAGKGNGNGSERPRGYFIGAVSAAISQFDREFTYLDLEKVIRGKGVEILAANPNVAINDVLVTLLKRGEVARSGKRGVQVLWKKTISAVESRTD